MYLMKVVSILKIYVMSYMLLAQSSTIFNILSVGKVFTAWDPLPEAKHQIQVERDVS